MFQSNWFLHLGRSTKVIKLSNIFCWILKFEIYNLLSVQLAEFSQNRYFRVNDDSSSLTKVKLHLPKPKTHSKQWPSPTSGSLLFFSIHIYYSVFNYCSFFELKSNSSKLHHVTSHINIIIYNTKSVFQSIGSPERFPFHSSDAISEARRIRGPFKLRIRFIKLRLW